MLFASIAIDPGEIDLIENDSDKLLLLIAKRIEGLNKDKALDWLLRDLASLERSLYQVWSEA